MVPLVLEATPLVVLVLVLVLDRAVRNSKEVEDEATSLYHGC